LTDRRISFHGGMQMASLALPLVLLFATTAPLLGQATLGPPMPRKSEPPSIEDPCAGFDWTKSKYRYQSASWLTGAVGIPAKGVGPDSMLDWVHGIDRKEAPKAGYPRAIALPLGFAEANFNYVDDPKHTPTFTERLHRIHLGDDWMFGTGGEYRNRFNYEGNSRLTGRSNHFDLNRIRIFGEIWYQDRFRVFAEFIDARTTPQTLTPLQTDRNHGDLLNLFVDVKTMTIADEAVYARLGRQQLILGSQRIISTADWGSANRTFDGVRVFRRSEDFDVDLFWLQPVIPKFDALDKLDPHQHFAGIYTSYRPSKDRFFDTYWLFLSNSNTAAQARNSSVGALSHIAPYDVHTLGFRYAGKASSGFLWDTENMLQLGQAKSSDIVAGNLTNGIGYHFGTWPLNPTVWAYFDYATGSSKLGGANTYNQLFPLAHYYLGQADYVGRANIEDLNFHLYLYPAKWMTFNMQYHLFWLARSRDALYNTAAAVSRVDPTGRAGREVGSELDASMAFHLSQNTDVLAVYSHFFPGNFLRATGPSSNMDTVYLLFNVRW
jgi:hypothetical protein